MIQAGRLEFFNASAARLFLASLIIAGVSFVAVAQESRQRAQEPTRRESLPGANVDETFELNIVERRYTQDHFVAETAVGTNLDEGKVNLQIGVALASGRIDVLLRNVHGMVRFRGSLDRVLQIINRQPAAPAKSQAPAPATPP